MNGVKESLGNCRHLAGVLWRVETAFCLAKEGGVPQSELQSCESMDDSLRMGICLQHCACHGKIKACELCLFSSLLTFGDIV